MSVGDLFFQLGIKINKAQWSAAHHNLSGLAKSAHSFERKMNLLKWGAVAAGVGIVKRTIGGLIHSVQDAGKSAVHINSLSQQIGISTTAVQEWAYVAEQAGSNIDEMSIGMVRLAKNMRAMVQGRNTIGTRALVESGITMKDAKEAGESSEAFEHVIYKISDDYLKLGLNANRAGLANETFGRQSKAFVADISRGSVALKELKKQIHDRGAILNQEEIDNSVKLGNNINNIKQEMKSFVHQGVARLAPMLNVALVKLTEWIAANKEVLISIIGGGVEAVVAIFQALSTVVGAVISVIEYLRSGTDEANALLIAVCITLGVMAGVILATVVPALWAMAVAVLAATWPFVLAIAIIALIAYGIMKLKKAGVFEAMGKAVDWVVRKLKAMWEWIKDLPRKIRQAFMDAGDAIEAFFLRLWEKIKQGALDLGLAINKIFSENKYLRAAINFGMGGNVDAGQNFMDMATDPNNYSSNTVSRDVATGGASSTAMTTNNIKVDVHAPNAKDPAALGSATATGVSDGMLRHAARDTGGKIS